MKTSTYKSSIAGIFYGAIVLLITYLIVSETSNNILFPTYKNIWDSLTNVFLQDIFWISFFKTIFDLFITLIISTILALLLAMFEIKHKYVNGFFTPLLTLIKCAPIAIISVYLHLLLGNNTGVHFIVFATTFPVIYNSFLTAINEIPQNIKNELTLSDVNFIKKYFFVYIPLIFPYVLSSIINSIGIGLKAAIMGGYLLYTENSLGYLIYEYKTTVEIENLIFLLLFIVLFCLLIEFISKYILKKLKEFTY